MLGNNLPRLLNSINEIGVNVCSANLSEFASPMFIGVGLFGFYFSKIWLTFFWCLFQNATMFFSVNIICYIPVFLFFWWNMFLSGQKWHRVYFDLFWMSRSFSSSELRTDIISKRKPCSRNKKVKLMKWRANVVRKEHKWKSSSKLRCHLLATLCSERENCASYGTCADASNRTAI